MAAAMMAVMIATVWWCCRAKGKVDLKKDATTQTEAPHLSACVPNQRLQDMYLTPQGERIHLDDDCPYIRGHQRRLRHPCARYLNLATAMWVEPNE